MCADTRCAVLIRFSIYSTRNACWFETGVWQNWCIVTRGTAPYCFRWFWCSVVFSFGTSATPCTIILKLRPTDALAIVSISLKVLVTLIAGFPQARRREDRRLVASYAFSYKLACSWPSIELSFRAPANAVCPIDELRVTNTICFLLIWHLVGSTHSALLCIVWRIWKDLVSRTRVAGAVMTVIWWVNVVIVRWTLAAQGFIR